GSSASRSLRPGLLVIAISLSTAATWPASAEKSASPRVSAYLAARNESVYCSVLVQSTRFPGSDSSCELSPTGIVKTTRSPTRAYSPRHVTTVPLVRNKRNRGAVSARPGIGQASRHARDRPASRRRATLAYGTGGAVSDPAVTLVSVARQHG